MPTNSPRCASHTGNKRLFPRSRRQQGFATGETTMSIKSWSLCLPPTLMDTRKRRVQPKQGADAGYDAYALGTPWWSEMRHPGASVLKAPYVTAKHGLIGLSKVVAKEGAKHGVRANVVCPGFVR